MNETARLAEAVAGLERVVGQVAAILEQHGRMLRQRLELVAKPDGEARPDEQTVPLIGRLDR